MSNYKLFLVTLPRYAIFAVILFLGLAIVFYKGGTMNDPSSIGYSFTLNFFSDLGRYKPENMISLVLFAVALGICGIIFNIYFYYFIKLFPKNSPSKIEIPTQIVKYFSKILIISYYK